jgi:hypothetical protein
MDALFGYDGGRADSGVFEAVKDATKRRANAQSTTLCVVRGAEELALAPYVWAEMLSLTEPSVILADTDLDAAHLATLKAILREKSRLHLQCPVVAHVVDVGPALDGHPLPRGPVLVTRNATHRVVDWLTGIASRNPGDELVRSLLGDLTGAVDRCDMCRAMKIEVADGLAGTAPRNPRDALVQSMLGDPAGTVYRCDECRAAMVPRGTRRYPSQYGTSRDAPPKAAYLDDPPVAVRKLPSKSHGASVMYHATTLIRGLAAAPGVTLMVTNGAPSGIDDAVAHAWWSVLYSVVVQLSRVDPCLYRIHMGTEFCGKTIAAKRSNRSPPTSWGSEVLPSPTHVPCTSVNIDIDSTVVAAARNAYWGATGGHDETAKTRFAKERSTALRKLGDEPSDLDAHVMFLYSPQRRGASRLWAAAVAHAHQEGRASLVYYAPRDQPLVASHSLFAYDRKMTVVYLPISKLSYVDAFKQLTDGGKPLCAVFTSGALELVYNALSRMKIVRDQVAKCDTEAGVQKWFRAFTGEEGPDVSSLSQSQWYWLLSLVSNLEVLRDAKHWVYLEVPRCNSAWFVRVDEEVHGPVFWATMLSMLGTRSGRDNPTTHVLNLYSIEDDLPSGLPVITLDPCDPTGGTEAGNAWNPDAGQDDMDTESTEVDEDD